MAKILLADDSIVMRRNIKAMLRGSNHQIIGEAENGKKAYMLALELNPDIITMDVNMPIMDGIEALKIIKTQNKEVKVIMLSSESDRQIVFQALEAGADNYLIKPIDRYKLLSVLDHVTETKARPLRKLSSIRQKDYSHYFKQIKEDNHGYLIINKGGIMTFYIGDNLSSVDIDELNETIIAMLKIENIKWHFEFENYARLDKRYKEFFKHQWRLLSENNHEYTYK